MRLQAEHGNSTQTAPDGRIEPGSVVSGSKAALLAVLMLIDRLVDQHIRTKPLTNITVLMHRI